MNLADGSKYEGEFAGDEISGYGIFTWPDGRTYKGGWMNNKMHGDASELLWADGRKYNGSFRNDKRHGNGTFLWADGKKYEGPWEDGK